MLSYEITYGIRKRWLVITLAFVPVFFLILSHLSYYVGSLNEGVKMPTTINYHIGKILYGIRTFDCNIKQRNRQLPVQWIIIQCSYLLMINGFINEEIHLRGNNIVKYGNFGKWWKRKIIWFYLISFLYYIGMAIILLIENVVENSIQIQEGVICLKSGYGEYGITVYIYTTIFFILHSLIMGMLQLCMELKIQSTIAFVITIGLIIIGVFSTKIFMPCHLAMLIRNSTIVDNNVLAISLIIGETVIILLESYIGRKICENGI